MLTAPCCFCWIGLQKRKIIYILKRTNEGLGILDLKIYESLILIVFNTEYIFVNALPHGTKFFGMTYSILR